MPPRNPLNLSCLLVLIVACGAYVRLSGLGEWNPEHDELAHLISIDKANSLSRLAQYLFNKFQTNHPPLIYLILRALLFIGDNFVLLAASAWLPGLLLIPVTYRIGVLVFEDR